MAPISTATRGRSSGRTSEVRPYPSLEVLRDLAKEVVVDWQLETSDTDRKD